MPELRWGATTNPGRVRNENEDTFVAEPLVFAVADGMGGHQAGEVASALAASIIRDRLGNGAPSEDYAVAVVNEVNAAIHGAARVDSTKSGMGTTLTAIAVLNATEGGAEQLVLMNVGDSRTYRYRNGRMQRVTVDHSYVQELVATGHITMEEARTHPRRNIVTRALGIEPNVRTDMWTLPIVRGDRFVLCSDGLVDEVPDDEILELVATVADPQALSQQLVDLANRHGGRDNVTVVVLDVLDGADPPDPTGEMPIDPSWVAAPAAPGGVVEGTFAPPAAAVDGSASPTVTPVASSSDPDPDVVPMTGPPPAPTLAASAASAAPPAAAPVPTSSAGPTLPPVSPISPTLPPAGSQAAGADVVPAPITKTTQPKRRRLSAGLALFIVLLAAIVIVTFTLIAVHERSGYYVGFDGDTVVVFKGQPEGILWFHPTVYRDTSFTRDSLPASAVALIDQHVVYDNVDDAVKNLQLFVPSPTTTTIAPSTTTTVAATSTTTAPSSADQTTTTVPSGP